MSPNPCLARFPGSRQRDPVLGFAAVGRPGRLLRVRRSDDARRLDALGVSGVVQGDHLFLPGPPADDPLARMAADCLTVLTTVAAHSSRLGIATLVANVGLGHPLPLLRRFANLAIIHGGERVYAGLGAGWSRAEFEALGLPFPPHPVRLERLDRDRAPRAHALRPRMGYPGRAHLDAVDVPLAPAPARPAAPAARRGLPGAPRARRAVRRPRRPRSTRASPRRSPSSGLC